VQRQAERQHESLGAAVDAIEDFRRNADGGGHVDDRPATARDQTRHGGIGQARQRADVKRDHLVHLVDVGRQQRPCGSNTGVVNLQRDPVVRPQHVLDAAEVFAVVEVGRDDLDRASRLIAETLGELRQLAVTARHQDQFVVATGQPIRVNRPNARRCVRSP
jgi:hypothetical protein